MSGIFNSSIFSNSEFNTGEAGAIVNLGAGGELGADVPRKRQRFLINVEGELTEVFSVQEAIFLLDELKAEKIEEVRRVAKRQAETRPERRKEVIHIPRIDARKLPPEIEQHRQEINKDLEIAYWLMFEQAITAIREIEREQEDEEALLLIL
jgi:hypothetical protein